MDFPGPALLQQKICQGQVEEQIAADVIADKVDPHQATGQLFPYQGGMVDQDQVAFCNCGQPSAGLHLHGEIAQVGAVTPQAGVQQGFEARSGFERGKLLPDGRKPLHIGRHLPLFLALEWVAALVLPGLEVAGRFQQATIEKGLGEVPRDLKPGFAGITRQRMVPFRHFHGRLSQGLDRSGGNLVA